MRKLASVLFLLLAVTANAQVGPTSGGGGSVSSGSAIGSCTSSLLYTDASTLLKCDPAAVVNGSVSTAGRSILTIRDTISGSSATSNFLNITGTMFSGGGSTTTGIYAPITGAGAGAGSQYAAFIDLKAGYTGAADTIGIVGINRSAGTNTTSGNAGGSFSTSSSTAGTNWGLVASSANAGAGPKVGALITLQDLTAVVPTAAGASAGLIVDNAAVAAKIFEARDNGAAVFTIADGGAVTFASTVALNGQTNVASGQFIGIGSNSLWSALYANTALTPDASEVLTGSAANSVALAEFGDGAYDFQNPCTTGLGTSACTDPTLIIHSHNQDTGEFLSMAHDGKAGVIVGGNSTVLDGTIRLGGTVTLTESSATAVLTVPVAVSTGTGGEIIYTVEARDATNTQIRAGKVLYAVANNSGGTETCNVFGISTTQAVGGDTTNAANPTQVQDGSGVGAITSGTLTYAWSVDTTGSNQCVLKLNAVSSLTQTTLQVHYTVIQSGPGVSTGGD